MTNSINYDYINKILSILKNNFRKEEKNKLSYSEILELLNDLDNLCNIFSLENAKENYIFGIDIIKIINFLIKYNDNKEYKVKLFTLLKNQYKYCARYNLEHFIIYYEWDKSNKVFEPRYKILYPYVYALNKMGHRETLYIVANLPSGWGKTFIAKLYEAWRLGIESSGSFISMCSNDNVVKAGSRLVKDVIIKSKEYGEIFPHLNCKKHKTSEKEIFLKQTDEIWALKDCQLSCSYLATTTNSNVVGQRADLSINIDDLYKNHTEALDDSQNEKYFNDFLTVWLQRYVQDPNKPPQLLISGTMWSPTDFLTKVINWLQKQEEFNYHSTIPFLKCTKDEKMIIVQVPALNEETGESNCPAIKSTSDLLILKESMDEYLWQTNFQQNPIAPEAMAFSWSNLITYENIPSVNGHSIAVIDGNRKSDKDFFGMPILTPYDNKYALIDCIFTKTATSELYNEIITKIIQYHITVLAVETNVNTELKAILEKMLTDKGIHYCEVKGVFQNIPKSTRIVIAKGTIKNGIVYPPKKMFGENTDMGKFMNNLTSYNAKGMNKNDDAPDSLALASMEIIEDLFELNEIEAVPSLL